MSAAPRRPARKGPGSGTGRARPRYKVRLYVVGGNVGSLRAEPDLRAALESCIPGRYDLQVIDLRKRPDLAEADRVLASPTVILRGPDRERRLIGDLSDRIAVCAGLGIEGEQP